MVNSDTPAPGPETVPKMDMQALSQLDTKEVADTEAFQRWAGEGWQEASQVLTGSDGAPKMFYHGGDQGVTEFSPAETPNTGEDQTGLYFTARLPNAKFYADKLQIAQAERNLPVRSSVYGVILKMENPLVLTEGKGFRYESTDAPAGYDGVINTKTQEAVAYDPSKVFIVAEAPMLKVVH